MEELDTMILGPTSIGVQNFESDSSVSYSEFSEAHSYSQRHSTSSNEVIPLIIFIMLLYTYFSP